MPLDMSAVATAPRPPAKRGPGRPPKAAPPPERSLREQRIDGLMGFAQGAQIVALMAGQPADAATIGMHAPELVPEVAKLAEMNSWAAIGVDFLIKVGPLTGFIAVALPFGLQIAVNHRWVKAEAAMSLPGSKIVPPEVLQAQMQAQVMRMQMDAMRAQREAAQAMEQMQREYAEFSADAAVSPNGSG
jgi:hypothetical protein